MKRTVQLGLLVAVVAVLLVGIMLPATADRGRDDNRCYSGYGSFVPPGPQFVPPGHQPQHHKWAVPGHVKHGDYDRYYDYRDGRYRDYRGAEFRYGDDDYGLVIRTGRRGTTIEGYYHNRDW